MKPFSAIKQELDDPDHLALQQVILKSLEQHPSQEEVLFRRIGKGPLSGTIVHADDSMIQLRILDAIIHKNAQHQIEHIGINVLSVVHATRLLFLSRIVERNPQASKGFQESTFILDKNMTTDEAMKTGLAINGASAVGRLREVVPTENIVFWSGEEGGQSDIQEFKKEPLGNHLPSSFEVFLLQKIAASTVQSRRKRSAS